MKFAYAVKCTDYWEMKKPHAVYLTMMAIGPWAEIKDTAKYAKPFSFEWGLVPKASPILLVLIIIALVCIIPMVTRTLEK